MSFENQTQSVGRDPDPHVDGQIKASSPVPDSNAFFSASLEDQVLFGNKEDYHRPGSHLWTDPASVDNQGCVCSGFKDYSHQRGINEKGLCFVANALPGSKINPHPELAFTRKEQGEDFLISSKINVANPVNSLEYPCPSYNKAREVWAARDKEGGLSVERFRSILESVP